MPRCGNCRQNHPTVEDVKACYVGRLPSSNDHAPAYAVESATEKQLDFAKSLAAQKDVCKLPEAIKAVLETVQGGGEVTKQEISILLTAMKTLPEVADRWPNVPEGKYALANKDGTVSFWEVGKPTQGQYAGRVFIKQIVGAPIGWNRLNTPRITGDATMDRIAKEPQQAARLFGYKVGHCGRCGAPLSNVRSRAAGFGASCANKLGWDYPSRAEARRMLQEMGVDPDSIVEQPEFDGLDVKAEDVFSI